MKNKGIVREITENSVKIELFKDVECSSCSKCDSKHHKLQSFFYDKKDLKLGEVIVFEIDNKSLLQFSFLIYILPLFFFFIFYGLASGFHLSENERILSSFLGLISGFVLIYIIDKVKGKSLFATIKITKENSL